MSHAAVRMRPWIPGLRRLGIGIAATTLLATSAIAADVRADPAADALARLNELSRQAEQTTEAMHSAEIALTDSLGLQSASERRHLDDQTALQSAQAELSGYQAAVDKVAAAAYMGGRTDGLTGILTATSPQQLIDDLALQRAMGTEMAATMARFRGAREQADEAERTSAKSAAHARAAAEKAAATRAELQAKQGELQVRIAAVRSQYSALTPEQKIALAAPGPAPEVPPSSPDILASADNAPNIEGLPPAGPLTPEGSASGIGDGTGNAAVVQAALTRVGSPYSWGAAGPDAFDCSGLIMWAFQQTGKSLPHSSQALANGGQPVALSDLRPGDIITFYADVSHAGIYIGDGMMVHASTYGTPVRVAPISSSPIHNARRY